MYKHILVPLENSAADDTILGHVVALAHLTRARLLLVHVADGWAARHYDQLALQESQEMKEDRAYLSKRASDLRSAGFEVQEILARGDPATEIVKLAEESGVDLIAMSTHGHKFFQDLLRGSTADKVRHDVNIPVLLLKAQQR